MVCDGRQPPKSIVRCTTNCVWCATSNTNACLCSKLCRVPNPFSLLVYIELYAPEISDNLANWLDHMVCDGCCWGLVLKYYELRTRQHKMLNVNVLRPSKHYFP
jgi:hypothetical protein